MGKFSNVGLLGWLHDESTNSRNISSRKMDVEGCKFTEPDSPVSFTYI